MFTLLSSTLLSLAYQLLNGYDDDDDFLTGTDSQMKWMVGQSVVETNEY